MSLTSIQKDYQDNKEAYMKRARRSYKKTFASKDARLHRMWLEAKSRAKVKNLEFSIEESEIKWNDICPVLGINITFERGKGRGGDDSSPSLDRINNLKGYVSGNVRLISNKANKLKNSMTREDCQLILDNWDVI